MRSQSYNDFCFQNAHGVPHRVSAPWVDDLYLTSQFEFNGRGEKAQRDAHEYLIQCLVRHQLSHHRVTVMEFCLFALERLAILYDLVNLKLFRAARARNDVIEEHVLRMTRT